MDLNEARKRLPELAGLSDESALNVIHQVYYPTMEKAALAERLGYKSPPPPAPERSMVRAAGDLGLQFGGGVVSGVRMMSDLFGADNAVSGGLRGAEDALRQLQSAAAKADQQRIAEIMKEAESKGFADQVVAGVRAFGQAPAAMIAQALGTSIPTLATAMIPGGAAARLAGAAGVGAAQGAGNIKGVIYEEVKNNPLPGETPEQTESRAARAQEYGGQNAGQIALGGGLGALAGSTGMERTLAGLRNGVTQAAPGMAARVGMGAAAEAVPEIAQGGQEKLASNLALRNEGFDVDPMAGVVAGATMEGLAGGVMGGAFGVPNPSVQNREPLPQPQPAPPVEPAGPMTRALNTIGPRITNTLTSDLLGRNTDPLAGQIAAERLAAEDSAVARNQFADRNAAALAGGGLDGSRADPLANMLADSRTAEANSFTNVQQAANRRPPMPASDAARILDEAKARGMDMTAAPHPDGGFVVVPRQWVTPDMAAQAETEIADTLARMQQADAAPVQRAERRKTEPVDLSLNTDPVAGYIEDLRKTNTPAARAYVGEFDAGRVTRADVEQRMQADRGLTADERLARAAAEGLKLNPKGDPFKTLMAANLAAKTTPGTVIEVPGGYAIRPQESTLANTAAQEVPEADAAPVQADEPAEAVSFAGAADEAGTPAVSGSDEPGAVQALSNVQDAPQATTGAPVTTGAATTEAEAAAVEAPAPARGDGAAAAGVPDAGAGAGVRADGVKQLAEQAKIAQAETARVGATSQDMDELQRVSEAEDAANERLSGALESIPDDQFGVQAKTSDGRQIILTPSAQKPGHWQLTRFARDGAPWGDSQYTTKKSAILDFLREVDIGTIETAGGTAQPAAKQQPQQDPDQQRRDFMAAEKKRAEKRARLTRGEWEKNPLREFLGRHGVSMDLAKEFAPGTKERRKAMVAGHGPIFRKAGKNIDMLAEAAAEEGFTSGEDADALYELIGKVFRGERVAPLFADGVAESEMEARMRRAQEESAADFEDFVAQQEEAGDPLASLMDDDYTLADIEGSGYAQASPELKAEVAALSAQLEAMGVDVESIVERVAQQTIDQTDQEYHEELKQALQQAYAEQQAAQPGSLRNTGEDGRSETGAAESGAGQEGLTAPTKADIEAQQARAGQAAREKAAADRTADRAAAQEEERKRIAKASEQAADTFELGGDAMANLTGQKDIFGAAEPEAETPRLTPAEAAELMEWQSLGTKDGVTKHILTFYESKAKKDANRGRMTIATITKGDRSATAWMVDGDDKTFGPLALAKKRGMEIGMAKAVSDGFVDAAKPAAPAQQEAREEPDYLEALFGTKEEQAASQARFEASSAKKTANIKRIRDAIGSEKKRAKAEYDDWAGRVYKGNKTQVDLRGDGPSNQASMSVGAINESRRRNAMEALSKELTELDKLEKAVESDIGAERVIGRLNDLMERAKATEGTPGGLGMNADQLFESILLDGMEFRGPGGKGNVTSNGLSKAMLAAFKGQQEATQATDDRAKPEPITPTAGKVDDFGEKLPPGSFMDPSLPVNTGASARMVVIDKPAGDVKFSIADTTPAFYSALKREINRLPTNAAPAFGWLSSMQGLVKNGKVKADELEWSGLNEWLKLQTGKVSKEDVLAFLDANGVQVTETVLGGEDIEGREAQINAAMDLYRQTYPAADAEEISLATARVQQFIDGELNLRDASSALGIDRQRLGAIRRGDGSVVPTKYSNYTLPGGENYREVLLTLPQSPRKARFDVVSRKDKSILKKADSREEAQAWIAANAGMPAAKGAEVVERPAGAPTKTEYKSSHWDQPNVLAHIRVNDRVDADGKRVLFVEEIQSDWGQDGKKKGFSRPNDQRRADELLAKQDSGQTLTDEEKAEARALSSRIISPIPAAPFVDKTDKWLALSLKRIMKMAVDGGYDRVAFVTGDQSAERYDLSKQVDQITYEDGTLRAFQKRTNVITKKAAPEELPDLIGKEVAQRLLDAPEEDGRRVLMGESLKVGGEGMKAFYDKIVPAAVKDVLKKVGGGQMEVVELESFDKSTGKKHLFDSLTQPGFTITESMREKVAGGLPLFSSVDGQAQQADTADYGPATQAHRDAAARLAESFADRIEGGGSHTDLLDAVAPGDGKRGQAAAAVANIARRLFRRQVVFVKFKGAPLFNGVVSKSVPGVIFLNIDSQKPLLSVLGHELLHEMAKSHPTMYANLSRRLDDLIKNETEYAIRTYNAYKKAGISTKGLDTREELEADIVGDNFMDAGFWQAMGENQPGLFQRIVNFVTKWLDNLSQKIADYRPFGTDEFLTDIAAARDAVASAMREFSGAEAGAVADPVDGDVKLSAAEKQDQADNADIRFSVVDDIRKAYADRVPDAVRDRIEDLTSSQRGFNRWWHGTVGTQLHKAKVNKEFGKVYYAVQDFMKDVSRMATLAADQAPDLLPQIDSLDDVKKVLPQMGIAGNRQRKADMKAASDALFDGTLRYTRDAYGEPVEAQNESDAGLVWTDAELKARGLNDTAIKLYRQARAAIEQSLENLMAADVYRMLTATTPEALANTPAEHAAIMAKVRKAAASDTPLQVLQIAGRALDQQADVLRKQLATLKKEMDEDYADGMTSAYTLAQDALKKIESIKERMDEKYERVRQLKAQGYAPLMRFGRYAVDVLDADGNRAFFGLYESQYEANRAARRFAEQGLRVSQSVKSAKEFEMLKGISPETAMLFADLLGVEKDEAMQKWLQNALAEQSALKRHIRRKGIAGFDDDAGRVVAAFLTSNSRAASRALHGLRIQESVENVRAGDVKDEAIKLADYVNNPVEEAQAVRSLLFINYIGGSVASALVNLTQTVVQTFPYLAQFGGARKGASRVTAAMKLAMGKIEDAELADAVKRAEADGVIKPQEVFQLQAEASRTLGSDIRVRAALSLWGSFFQMAEQFNRRVAFIAAYQTAKQEGIRNPFAFAENAVDETQGVFNKGNRPDWSRGAIGATLFTFKTFTIQYVEFLKRLPPKERALALGVLVLLAGFRGLPFAEDAEDIIDTVAQAMGYNFTTKAQMDQFLVSTLGQPFADFLQHGASGTGLLPFDVSQRLGMADLLPATGVLKPSETRKDDQILEVFGVAGSFVRDTLKGQVAPVAIRNAAKGIDMYDRGIYTDTRGRKVMDVGPVDAAMKAIGLQPAGVAAESRKAGSVYEMRALFTKVKSEISEQMALGQFENDPAKIQKARDRLADWNEKNPDAQIRLNGQAIRRRVTEMRKDRSERLLKTTPRELRAQAQEVLE